MDATNSNAPPSELAASLVRMHLLSPGEKFSYSNLAGGVSCDVWKIDVTGREPIIVKRALAQLRVAADWRAPPERATAEVAWLRLVDKIAPSCAPEVLGEDADLNMFAMKWLPPSKYSLWKSSLAAGQVSIDFAGAVGRKLALIHSATAQRADVAQAFMNDRQFFALRLEPYMLYTASKNSDVAPEIDAAAKRVAAARIALMHGDVSPKNILQGPDGPVFLDAETACYGDPAFDLAFCLNHLLLKCVWRPNNRLAYMRSFLALRRAYLENVDWEKGVGIESRTARLLAILLLARIDGKSPVEYLTLERDVTFVRVVAKEFIKSETVTLLTIADIWMKRLDARAH